MKHSFILSFLSTALFLAEVSATAQSAFRDFANALDATLDGAREMREQDAAPANIRAIFAKAAEAEEDGNINFCGFYIGMTEADAAALAGHYGLKPGESTLNGDPVFDIQLSLHGVRRITKGGNSYDELCQAVANRVGDLKHMYDSGGWEEKSETWYEYKNIDGVRLTMSEESLKRTGIVAGFHLWDGTGKIKAVADRKKAEAERRAREERMAAERKKAEAERRAREAREAAERTKELRRFAELRDSLPQIIDSIIASMVSIPGKDYKMGKTEVTQMQWMAVMGNNPSHFKGKENPVEMVSWYDCQKFLKKFNELPKVKTSGLMFRLPTEEEWEYACSAGATGGYCKLANGTDISADTLGKVAWFEDNSYKQVHPVGHKEPNAFGLYDMHGNVWEWTQTAAGELRLNRGGSWNGSAWLCTLFAQPGHPSDYRSNDLGFRLCVSGSKEQSDAIRKQFDANGTNSEVKETENEQNSTRQNGASQIAQEKKASQLQEKQDGPIQSLVASMVQIPCKNYWMGKYEVTQAQWETVMGNNPARFKNADNPVESVTWDECQEFLKILNALPEVRNSGLVFRLPTDAEWEYACQAGATGKFCKLSDGTEITEDTLEHVAWFTHNSDKMAHPVGQKAPNAFGLYDMHGNVDEWCQDEFGEVVSFAKGEDYEHDRIHRGGSWAFSARVCAVSFPRTGFSPDRRSPAIGFRLCASGRAD